jgi:hypothetical protein
MTRITFRWVAACAALISCSMISSASAADFRGSDLLVPVASRTPGANGSIWRTDLTVTNLSTTGPVSIAITFTSEGEQSFTTRVIEPRETIVLDDVVLTVFDRSDAIGTIRITSGTEGAQLAANARIYNAGSSSGEFGQGVLALPVDGLTRDHYLTGLTGTGGNRTNVGISNPWDVPNGFIIALYDRDGMNRGSFTSSVGPRQVVQLNDVFASFSAAPVAGATVHVVSEFPVYTYASIVRGDSGDARFIPGTGFARGHDVLLSTVCSYAAPVNVVPPERTAAPGWIVKLIDEETDPVGRIAFLAGRYGFVPTNIFDALKMFTAPLTPQQIAALRCDTSVAYIQQNEVIPPP